MQTPILHETTHAPTWKAKASKMLLLWIWVTTKQNKFALICGSLWLPKQLLPIVPCFSFVFFFFYKSIVMPLNIMYCSTYCSEMCVTESVTWSHSLMTDEVIIIIKMEICETYLIALHHRIYYTGWPWLQYTVQKTSTGYIRCSYILSNTVYNFSWSTEVKNIFKSKSWKMIASSIYSWSCTFTHTHS